jgi:hypothetical protein
VVSAENTNFARLACSRSGRWQFRLRTLILAMLLSGPLVLAGRHAFHEIERQREQANRPKCAGGLKQLTIALHNSGPHHTTGWSDDPRKTLSPVAQLDGESFLPARVVSPAQE